MGVVGTWIETGATSLRRSKKSSSCSRRLVGVALRIALGLGAIPRVAATLAAKLKVNSAAFGPTLRLTLVVTTGGSRTPAKFVVAYLMHHTLQGGLQESSVAQC